jgi:flagellar export protein FliJ
MAGSQALRRLLQVLEIEEEQAKLALEAAVGDLRLLEQSWAAAVERSRSGRQLVTASAGSGNLTDRWAGLEEARAGTRRASQLMPRIADAKSVVGARRQEFLSRRVERRQAETLIEEAEAREAVEARRRGQRTLDDWYLNRLRRIERGAGNRGADGETCKYEKPLRPKLEEKSTT